MLDIHPETSADYEAIRVVNRLAFGREDEARLVDDLRDGGYSRLSLVAERDGQVVGHILFSELRIIGELTVVVAALAPMAVLPEHQNQGIGSSLVRRGLELCAEQGHPIVIVLGHPHFYHRFGFSSQLAARLESPYASDACMAVELTPGAIDGVTGRVEYAPPFQAL